MNNAQDIINPQASAPPPQHYRLRCSGCDFRVEDDGTRLNCPELHSPALLVADYSDDSFQPTDSDTGLYRYKAWLPVRRLIPESVQTITYQSKQLCHITGLRNLWIAFHGYWPERNAFLGTGTFKDLEAYCVLGRLPSLDQNVLVVASAGNTAAAFADACSRNSVSCLLVVPEWGLENLRFAEPISPLVKLVVLTAGADYSDAIALSEIIGREQGFILEGGTKNVARRDGLGTVMLNAHETIGRLPEFYFQAIGSGAGAIAAHESARRLTRNRGPFPSLQLSQNLPFVPIYDAWKAATRELPEVEDAKAKHQIAQMSSKVLSNRKPPWGITGGLYEAIIQSQGNVMAISNSEADIAAQLFEEIEHIDLDPAGAVAFASILKAISLQKLRPDATVLLNVTGGGRRRRANDQMLPQRVPDLTMSPTDAMSSTGVKKILNLFPWIRTEIEVNPAHWNRKLRPA